jgi:hypothetical protein
MTTAGKIATEHEPAAESERERWLRDARKEMLDRDRRHQVLAVVAVGGMSLVCIRSIVGIAWPELNPASSRSVLAIVLATTLAGCLIALDVSLRVRREAERMGRRIGQVESAGSSDLATAELVAPRSREPARAHTKRAKPLEDWFWRLATVLVVAGLGLACAVLFGAFPDTKRHRWTFTEAVPDISALGFATPVAQGGEWSLKQHREATGGRALVNHRGPSGHMAAVALAPVRSGHNMRIVTRCKVESGHPEQACGMVFGFQDAANHYVARLDARARQILLVAVVRDSERVLARANATIVADVWQEIAVEVRADHLLVGLNGSELIDVRDKTLPPSGTIGLWAPSTCVAYFDELMIELGARG